MVGLIAVSHLERFHVEIAFIGTDGFSLANGLTAHMMEETEVVRAMCDHSDRTVLPADSGKWYKSGFARVIPLEEVDDLVVNLGLPREMRKEIESLGIQLHIVKDQSSNEHGLGDGA